MPWPFSVLFFFFLGPRVPQLTRAEFPRPRQGSLGCLLCPFLPSPPCCAVAGVRLLRYPGSCFTSSGKDPTVKVPFQVSFPTLATLGRREGEHGGMDRSPEQTSLLVCTEGPAATPRCAGWGMP